MTEPVFIPTPLNKQLVAELSNMDRFGSIGLRSEPTENSFPSIPDSVCINEKEYQENDYEYDDNDYTPDFEKYKTKKCVVLVLNKIKK